MMRESLRERDTLLPDAPHLPAAELGRDQGREYRLVESFTADVAHCLPKDRS